MKLLFDVIYSTQPHKCSSAAKYKKIAKRILEARSDAFIYWLIPNWANDDARAWFPKDERIRYIELDCTKDRVREYQVYRAELENCVAFFGQCWDYDVLITMRTSQVPTMRSSMNSSRMRDLPWLKKVVLLEEMAILDFRKTVPISNAEAQDALTVLGYLCADVTYITADHVRRGILQEGRKIFAPSRARQLDAKIRLVNPTVIEEYEAKEDKFRFKRGAQPFCLGFVGRMGTSMTRLPDIYDLMDKNWIMKGDQGFKVLISTISTSIKLVPPEFVVVENNTREQFWERLRHDMHLVISMSIDAEFSLGLVECIVLGTPLVITRADWTEGLLGKEYPFFAEGKLQAAGIIKAFHDDYEACYKTFLDWRQNVFRKRFEAGGLYERNLYDDMLAEVIDYDIKAAERLTKDHPGKSNGELINTVMSATADRDEFVLHEVITELEKGGAFKHFSKDEFGTVPGVSMPFYTPFHEWKAILRAFGGWTDASTKLGHFRRIKS